MNIPHLNDSDLLQGITVLAGECFCIVILFWPALPHLQRHAVDILHTLTDRCTQTHTQECTQMNSRTAIT